MFDYLQAALLAIHALGYEADEVPPALAERLEAVRGMIRAIKPYGDLRSSQIVATIVLHWHLDEMRGD